MNIVGIVLVRKENERGPTNQREDYKAQNSDSEMLGAYKAQNQTKDTYIYVFPVGLEILVIDTD